MKRLLIFLCTISVQALEVFAGDGTIRPTSKPVSGSYIVVLDERSPAALRSDAVLQSVGGRRRHVYDIINGFSFSGDERQAAALSRRPDVVAVYQNGLAQLGTTQFDAPRGLDRIDQGTLPLNNQYDYSYAGIGVRIYILDSGVAEVSDLAGRLVERVNFVAGQTSVDDCNGHGTKVASITAGTVYGIAKGAEVASVRVSGECESPSLRWDDFIAGVNYVRQQKLNNPTRMMVANASIWGDVYPLADQAVRNLVTAGVGIALIAGNGDGDNADLHSPGRIGASTAGAMTTGATVPNTDYVTGGSSQGSVIDIFAPTNVMAMSYNGRAYLFPGTSAAAPHTAGVMAKLLEQFPSFSAAQIENTIRANATTGVRFGLPEIVHGRTLGSPDRLLYSGIRKTRS